MDSFQLFHAVAVAELREHGDDRHARYMATSSAMDHEDAPGDNQIAQT